MMLSRAVRNLFGWGAIALMSASCGDVARSGRAPVFLVVDSLQAAQGNGGQPGNPLTSDVITNVRTPLPCTAAAPCPTVFNDIGTVALRVVPKNIGSPSAPSATSSNNDVTINRYRVRYRRADGRNVEGADVPYGFDGGVTGTIPVNGSASLSFEIVRHVAKEESPLVQLKTSATVITVICDVTFYGSDLVGNEINVTGSMLIEFGNFGDF